MGSYQVVDRCDFQAGNVINNQYTVRKTLGEGSFGVVYLVEDRRGTKYALKLLRLWEKMDISPTPFNLSSKPYAKILHRPGNGRNVLPLGNNKGDKHLKGILP